MPHNQTNDLQLNKINQMIAPTIVGLISIIISKLHIKERKNTRKVLFYFIPIFAFLTFRYDYGNDYYDYLEIFNEIASLQEMDYDSKRWRTEIGWLIINRIFSNLSFFVLMFFTAGLTCYIYARFINLFVPSRYFWLAIFFYVFIPENLLVQSSAMRQGLAILLFILSMEAILRKNFLNYLLIIGLASTFHSSALILIPVYFIGSADLFIKKSWIPFLIFFYIILFFFAGEIISIGQNLFILDEGSIFERYAIYEEKGSLGSGFGVIFYGLYLFVLLYYHDQQNKSGKLLFRMSIISIYLIPFIAEVSMLIRIGFYFSVFSIVTVPIIANQIKSYILSTSFVTLHILYAIWGYLQFFNNPIWQKNFSEYRTIFELIL